MLGLVCDTEFAVDVIIAYIHEFEPMHTFRLQVDSPTVTNQQCMSCSIACEVNVLS